MSIDLVGVTKVYRTLHGRHEVFRDLDLSITRGHALGVIGRNGAGKSTLLRLISGADRPNRGRVTRRMSVSWPLGFTGFFHLELTGAANVKFAARLHGRDPAEVLAFVRDFAELGRFLDWPVKGYSTGMRAKLGFALSLAMQFDCLLVDEVLSVGDAGFRERIERKLLELREERSLVIVSHNLKDIMRLCDRVLVLGEGPPRVSDDVRGTVKAFYHARGGSMVEADGMEPV